MPHEPNGDCRETLAIVELALQGIQVRCLARDRITVTLPAFRHPRDGMMRTAILLPKELADAIGAEVASAYDRLEYPILMPGGARGVTSLSTR